MSHYEKGPEIDLRPKVTLQLLQATLTLFNASGDAASGAGHGTHASSDDIHAASDSGDDNDATRANEPARLDCHRA